MMMDRFVEEKFVALLMHYGIPEDAPGAGWHSAAAGWRFAGALAHDLFPWIGRTDDAPPKPVGRQRKTADEKLVMAVEAARAKRGATSSTSFCRCGALARIQEAFAAAGRLRLGKASVLQGKGRDAPPLIGQPIPRGPIGYEFQ